MGSLYMDRAPRGSRYSQGWRSRDQDRSQLSRVAKAEKQQFAEIRRQCLAQGGLWEDPDFPATTKTVFYSSNRGYNFQWKRPHEICSDPRMIVEGASRFDVKQGDLGNCWFLAAVASLCASANASHGRNKHLLTRVVPPDNSFQQDYAGVVHFCIWQYGRWVDVVIDDRLPTLNGRLMFMHSADENEFWSALLEKAYAKLNGSYEALQGGAASEAMEDFTGGICETFNLQEMPKDMFKILKKADQRGSLMGCSIDANPGQMEAVLANGLVMGHAYSVTGVKEIHQRGQKVKLVRVRNPWGNQQEWKGAWSDSSREVQSLSAQEKAELGLSIDDDGEFWMEFGDFAGNFMRLEICNLKPDTVSDYSDEAEKKRASRRWESNTEDGSWKTRVNAGGCRNYLDTFWTNPQYKVEVVDPDEEDDENMGTVIIGLLQKERRKKKKEGLDMLTIGYSIYKLDGSSSGSPLDMEYFKYNRAIARSPTFSNMREICGRHKLEPGTYCIIPSTFEPHKDGDFLLRIFSEKPNKTNEMDESTGFVDDQPPQNVPVRVAPTESKPGQKQATVNIKTLSDKRRRIAKQVTQDDVNEENSVRAIFKRKAGVDLEVDAYELREILDEQLQEEVKVRPRFRFGGFSLETCRSLVAMMDIDHSGKLGYEEFKKLWADIRMWKKIFKEYDSDGNGTFNSYELRQALHAAGFRISNHTFDCLVMRYSGPQGKIYFDDYMLCAARLNTMFATYKDCASQGGGSTAPFKLDHFIQTTMYS